jgi:hypothetical protein
MVAPGFWGFGTAACLAACVGVYKMKRGWGPLPFGRAGLSAAPETSREAVPHARGEGIARPNFLKDLP